jgi:hypothetical protein
MPVPVAVPVGVAVDETHRLAAWAGVLNLDRKQERVDVGVEVSESAGMLLEKFHMALHVAELAIDLIDVLAGGASELIGNSSRPAGTGTI